MAQSLRLVSPFLFLFFLISYILSRHSLPLVLDIPLPFHISTMGCNLLVFQNMSNVPIIPIRPAIARI